MFQPRGLHRLALRDRIVLVVGVSLVLSFVASSAVAILQARRLVREELTAELETGAQAARNALQALPLENDQAAALARLTGMFNGSRHVQAELVGAGGVVQAASVPGKPNVDVPPVFAGLVRPVMHPSSVPAGARTLLLLPWPRNEIGERWVEFKGRIWLLLFFSASAASLIFLMVTHGLAPLKTLLRALGRLGGGERGIVLPEAGTPEIAALARGFNHLSVSLEAAERSNRQLEARMLDLAAEERAEIARDLHDEVGPLLFAIGTFAGAISRNLEAGEHGEAEQAVRGIHSLLATLTAFTRDLIGRLGDTQLEGEALRAAAGRMLAFWRQIQPGIGFVLEAEDDAWDVPPAVGAAMLRMLGESVSNAIRHGGPGEVRIALRRSADAVHLAVQDDGSGGEAAVPGFGLSAMRQRVQALGGTLSVASRNGWLVDVMLPLHSCDSSVLRP